jgi:hypothetical protein
MPIVQLPDGNRAQFPDDMTLDEIKSILAAKYPAQEAAIPEQQVEQPEVDDVRVPEQPMQMPEQTQPQQEQAPQNLWQQAQQKMADRAYQRQSQFPHQAAASTEMVKAFPGGAGESLKRHIAALQGNDFTPEEVDFSDSYYPEASAKGRAAGEFAGSIPIPLAVGGGTALAASTLGAPAALAGLLGGAASGAATTPGGVGERGVAAIEEGLLGAATGGAPKILKALFGKKTTQKQLGNQIQAAHDAQKADSSAMFKNVTREAEDRGISKVNFDKSLVNEAERYLSNTQANRDLLKRAESGNYDDLRKLQSDLRSKGEKRLQSDLASERDAGEEMLDVRNNINQSIGDHFRKTGNEDLADMLTEASSKYKNLKDTYYTHNRIAKLVDKDKRLVPKDMMKLLSEDSKPMNDLLKAHPEVKSQMDQILEQQRIAKMLKKGVTVPLGVGVAYEGAKGIKGIADKLLK